MAIQYAELRRVLTNGHLSTMKTSALAVALSTLCIANVRAQVGGRDLPVGLRSLAGVTLNRDSAASIRAKLGTTRERRVGGGRDALVEWCYLPPGSAHGLLELMSDASAMGTPGRELDVIRLRSEAPSEEREDCVPLHASSPLSTPAGLRLGLDVAQITHRLGAPERMHADSLICEFATKEYLRPGTPEYERWNTMEYRESCFDAGPPYANVLARVIVLLRNGRAVEIRMERYDRSVC